MSVNLPEVLRAISDYEHVILDFHFEDDKFRELTGRSIPLVAAESPVLDAVKTLVGDA